MIKKLKFLMISLIFISQISSAQLVPGDVSYQQVDTPSKETRIYYSNINRDIAQKIYSQVPSLNQHYKSSFGFELDEKLHLILASTTHNQILNGFSTQFPHNLTLFYGGGGLDVDYFATHSWVDTLLTHELAHNYQINSKKSSISKFFNTTLGNSPFQSFFLPFFPFPNIVLPTFIIEGNAVLNESTYTNGGRLYSGEIRALVFAYLKEGMLTANSMINTKLEFPYGQTAYIVGGYFHAYLATRFGVKKVNSFFENNSSRSVAVLSLNRTFKETFGYGYDTLIKDFLNYHKDDLENFRYLKGKILGSSISHQSLTKLADEIYYMSSAQAGNPTISTYNITNGNILKKQGNWIKGKPFKLKGKFYTRSAQSIDTTHIQAALFDNQRDLLPNSAGKSFQDINVVHNKVSKLWIDVSSSFNTQTLIKNSKKLGTVNSSAILDKENNYYFFKNSGKTRTLYKNSSPLFSYQGHWGFPVDIIDKNIYFVAPTAYGSTLYMFSLSEKKINRLNSADNIIDAKMINTKKFIASTVTAKSYQFVLSDVENSLTESPHNITYSFEASSPVNLKMNKISFKDNDTRSYNSLTNLKFSNITPSIAYTSSSADDYFSVYIPFIFVDPLMINTASIAYLKGQYLEGLITKYQNKRYRLQYSITATHFFTDNEYLDHNWLTRNPSGKGGSLSLFYPLYKKSDSSIDLQFNSFIDYDDSHKNPLILNLSFNKRRNYGIATKPQFIHNLSFFYKYDKGGYTLTEKKDISIYGANYSIGRGFSSETFLGLSLKYGKSNSERSIILNESEDFSFDRTDFKLDSLDYNYYAHEILSTSINLSQTIYLSAYGNWFPLGIRREDLFIEYELINLKGAHSYSLITNKFTTIKTISELRLGLDIEFLGLHKSPITGRIAWIKNSENFSDNTMKFSFGSSF